MLLFWENSGTLEKTFFFCHDPHPKTKSHGERAHCLIRRAYGQISRSQGARKACPAVYLERKSVRNARVCGGNGSTLRDVCFDIKFSCLLCSNEIFVGRVAGRQQTHPRGTGRACEPTRFCASRNTHRHRGTTKGYSSFTPQSHSSR